MFIKLRKLALSVRCFFRNLFFKKEVVDNAPTYEELLEKALEKEPKVPTPEELFEQELHTYKGLLKKAIKSVEDTRYLFPQPKANKRNKSDAELGQMVKEFRESDKSVEQFSAELKTLVNQEELTTFDFFTVMNKVDPIEIPLEDMMPFGTKVINFFKYGDAEKIKYIKDVRLQNIARMVENWRPVIKKSLDVDDYKKALLLIQSIKLDDTNEDREKAIKEIQDRNERHSIMCGKYESKTGLDQFNFGGEAKE